VRYPNIRSSVVGGLRNCEFEIISMVDVCDIQEMNVSIGRRLHSHERSEERIIR
jgi:hypothetical protein